MWPWTKRFREAEKRVEEAEERKKAADVLAAKSRMITEALRYEVVEKNGWTEMLSTAWGRR